MILEPKIQEPEVPTFLVYDKDKPIYKVRVKNPDIFQVLTVKFDDNIVHALYIPGMDYCISIPDHVADMLYNEVGE